jgi:hypothetical protein
VVSTALVVSQRRCKRITAAVSQQATMEEVVFSVGADPMLYKEDLRQLELELSRVLEFQVTS